MAEELRIVLQDDGAAAALTQAASAATTLPPPPVSSTPPSLTPPPPIAPLADGSVPRPPPSDVRPNALLDEAFGLGTTPPPPTMPPSEAPGVTGGRIQLVQIVAPLPLAVTILDLPPGSLTQGVPAPPVSGATLPPAGTPGGPAGPPAPTPAPPPFDPEEAARTQAANEAKSRASREAYLTKERPDLAVSQIAGAAGMGNLAKLAGSLGELSLAAGPIGAAVAGVQALGAASDLAAGVMNTATRGIQQMSTVAIQLAGNDYLGAFQTGVQATAETLQQIPVVGGALASALKLATAPVIAFAKVVEAVVERGAELARFSPELTASRALADARAMLGDIREAEQLGPGMASITDAQSRIWDELREILLPIKKFLVETLAGIMQGIAAVVELIGSVLTPIAEGITAILGLLRDIIGTILKPIFDLLKIIAKAVRWLAGKEDKMDNPSAYMQKIMDEIQKSFDEEVVQGIGVGGGIIEGIKARGNKLPGDLGQDNLWGPGVAFGGAFP